MWFGQIVRHHAFRIKRVGNGIEGDMTTRFHYNDVTMSAVTSQITVISTVCLNVYSGAHQRKHRSSSSLAFGRGIHWWPVDSPHKGPATRKMFPSDDVIMWCYQGYDTTFEFMQQWCSRGSRGSHTLICSLCGLHASLEMLNIDMVFKKFSSMASKMTSSNGNIFRVTGHLCGEFTGPRWSHRTKASDAELWCFLWSAPE